MATAKVILLSGDSKTSEPATHIIKFPGGSIELSRTTANDYWVHINVHTGLTLADTIRESKNGEVTSARLDYDDESIFGLVENLKNLSHLAVRIQIK